MFIMPRPKGVNRFRKTFTLSKACIRKLEDLARERGLSMSRYLEDLIMAAVAETATEAVSDPRDPFKRLHDIESKLAELLPE